MRGWLTLFLVVACFTALFLTCYSSVLFGGGQFGYRDAGHYYYPLHERVQREWNAGRWPLWEPEENGGTPLLGNPTAAVLYPGKAVFAILPYAWAARFYIVSHTALAFLTMLVLMRSWRTSWFGSALAGLSYAFGAPILFQYSNVIYLVGAAWLPLGLHAVDRWVRLGRRWGILELAVVLAMQVLGGDLETAYILGLAAVGYAAGITWSQARPFDRGKQGNDTPGLSPPERRRRVVVALIGVVFWAAATLAVAALLQRNRPGGLPAGRLAVAGWLSMGTMAVWILLAVGLVASRRKAGWRMRLRVVGLGLIGSAALAASLSAAQLLPVLEFSRLTVRWAAPELNDIYMYSVEPFRLVELAWPNVFGVHFGTNRYWRDAFDIPGVRPELWSPSLYLGGLTLVLACGELGFRRGPPWRVWLCSIVVASLLATLGRYASPLWAARAILQALRSPALLDLARCLGRLDPAGAAPVRLDGFLRDGDGGIYWWLATALPGFRQFRFPAKFFTFTALGLAALAGSGWDSAWTGDHRRVRNLFALILFSSLALLSWLWIAWPSILETFRPSVVSSTYGPIDINGVFRIVAFSLAQAAIVSSAGLLAVRLVRTHRLWAGAIVLVVMSADLALANARHVVTVPQAVMESTPEVLQAIEDHERKSPSSGPFRVHRMAFWEPRIWQTTSAPGRALDVASWHRDTLYPKHGINFGIEYTHVFGVGGLVDFEPFFTNFLVGINDPEAARMLGFGMGQPVDYYPRRSFDIWNTRYFIIPAISLGRQHEYRGCASFLFRTEQIYPNQGPSRNSNGDSMSREWIERRDVQVLRNLDEFPRAWVVHDARWVDSTDLARQASEIALKEMLFANDPLWHDAGRRTFDPRTLAWVDMDRRLELSRFLSGQAPRPTETVKVSYPTPQRVELEAALESPGLVILADLYYPGWELTLDGIKAPIYRVNRAMRGAAVPAGKHKLVYSYAPLSFRAGRLVSISGLMVLALGCAACALWPNGRR